MRRRSFIVSLIALICSPIAAVTHQPHPIVLATWFTPDAPGEGKITDVRVWDRQLTEEEIRELYETRISPPGQIYGESNGKR